MMDTDYIRGAGGFIGRRLFHALPSSIQIPRWQVGRRFLPDCGRFFFLSAYGNMAHHTNLREMFEANTCRLVDTLDNLIISGRCGLFVYTSSSSAMLPVQTPYSRMKAAGEQLVMASGLPALILRFFSVTGVGEQHEHLIPTLIRSCFEQTPMDLVMDATHDFVDVEDVVSGIMMLADQKATGVFELGRGISWSNREVMEMVEAASGKKAVVREVENLRSYDCKDWCCRNFAAAQAGWKPQKALHDSIVEMVEAYKREHP